MVRSLLRPPAVVLQNNEEMLLDSKNPLHRSDSSNMTYANDDSEAEYLSRIEEDTALYSSNNSASQRGALVTGVIVQQQDDCEIIAEKKVRFSQIDFRVFYMSLGDNPGCSHGPPLTIEWDHFATQSMNVDDWEEHRPWRRRGSQLKVPWLERRRMLRECFSDLEIVAANEEVRRVHAERLATIQRQRFEKLELLSQKLLRKVKRAFVLPKQASKTLLDSFLNNTSPQKGRRDSDDRSQLMGRKYASTSRIDVVSSRQLLPKEDPNLVPLRPVFKKWTSERIFNQT